MLIPKNLGKTFLRITETITNAHGPGSFSIAWVWFQSPTAFSLRNPFTSMWTWTSWLSKQTSCLLILWTSVHELLLMNAGR